MLSKLFTAAAVIGLSAGLTFATVTPAQAATCGAGQIENGGFEAVTINSLVLNDIYVFHDGSGTGWDGRAVWDNWTNTKFFAIAKALPVTTSQTTASLVWSASEGAVELQQHSNSVNSSIYAHSGNQWAEITGLDVTNTLYQTVATVPGSVMTWSLAHRGLSGTDVMQVQIGDSLANLVSQNATPATGSGVSNPTHISDGTAWRVWTGTYEVPAGQTSTVFGFHGVSSGSGSGGLDVGNLIDSIGFTCDQTLSSASLTKTVTFNSNDGTNTTSTQSSATTANLNNNSFTRSGYTFSGWNTAQNGTGTSYRDQAAFAFSSDVPLYAQWTANQSVVTPTASPAALATTGSPNSVLLWLGISSMLAGALFSVSSALNKTRSASTR